MPITSKIPALLAASGKTASDLMRATGTAYSTAHYLAKGKLGTSLDFVLLERICKFFGVGIEDVLELSSDNSAGAIQVTPTIDRR